MALFSFGHFWPLLATFGHFQPLLAGRPAKTPFGRLFSNPVIRKLQHTSKFLANTISKEIINQITLLSLYLAIFKIFWRGGLHTVFQDLSLSALIYKLSLGLILRKQPKSLTYRASIHS